MVLVDIAIENDVRVVAPYYYEYKIPAKGRWFGKTLVDWCFSEFGEDESVVIADITSKRMFVMSLCGRKGGPVRVDGWKELCDRPIVGGDLIHRTKHVHEPPVPCPLTIEIVYQDDQLLVVNKPSGMPTHPCGNYHHNSVTEMLKHSLSLLQVWPCHRLDKVTSGILVLGKSQEAGAAFATIIQNEKSKTHKVYVARVVGKFPHSRPVRYTSPVFSVNGKGSYITPSPHHLPVDSSTIFERLSYDASCNHSIVKCRPLTGRTHQIRIHLRNLGYPIANDHVYNPSNPELAFFVHNKAKLDIERYLYDRLYQKYTELQHLAPVFHNPPDSQNLLLSQDPLISQDLLLSQDPLISQDLSLPQDPLVSQNPLIFQDPLVSQDPLVFQGQPRLPDDPVPLSQPDLQTKHNQSIKTIDIYKAIDWDTDTALHEMLTDMVSLRDRAVAQLIGTSSEKCNECGKLQFSEDSNTAALQIWLHALEFQYESQVFKTSMPDWCN